MSRFYRTARLELLQGTQYRAPGELLMKAMEQDNQVRSAIEQQNMGVEQQLLSTPHLQFDKELLDKVTQSYKDDIDQISQSVYNDVNVLDKARPKMRDMSRRLLMDKLSGNLGAIENRYAAMNKFKEMNKDVEAEDPMTYRIAMQHELTKLAMESRANPRAIFTPYRVVAKPDFRKAIVEEVSKLKANVIQNPAGNGYLMKNGVLDESRILDVAMGNILGNPKYREYAMQQSMYGLGGFHHPDGTEITPYAVIDSRTGEVLTGEQIDMLTPENKKYLKRSVNPRWRFYNEVKSIIDSHNYRQVEMSPDQVVLTKMKMAQDDRHHAAKMALDAQKFAYEKMDKDRRYELARLKAEGAFDNDDNEYYGGSSKNSRGGGGSSGGGNGLSGSKNALGSVYDTGMKPYADPASDFSNYRNSSQARTRIDVALRSVPSSAHYPIAVGSNGKNLSTKDFLEYVRDHGGGLNSNSGFLSGDDNDSLARNLVKYFKATGSVNQLIIQDAGNSKGIAMAMGIHPTKWDKLSAAKKKEIKLEGLRSGKLVVDMERSMDFAEKQIEKMYKNILKPHVEKAYKRMNELTSQTMGYGVTGRDQAIIINNIASEQNAIKVYNGDGKEVPVAKFLREYTSGSDKQLYVHPGSNTKFSGHLQFIISSDKDSKGGKTRKEYRVVGNNSVNSVVMMGYDAAKKNNKEIGYLFERQMDPHFNKLNSGDNTYILSKSEINQIGYSLGVGDMSSYISSVYVNHNDGHIEIETVNGVSLNFEGHQIAGNNPMGVAKASNDTMFYIYSQLKKEAIDAAKKELKTKGK